MPLYATNDGPDNFITKRALMNFQEHYAGLSEDELLAVAADRRDLLEEAGAALNAEMMRRGLSYKQAREKKSKAARQEVTDLRKQRTSQESSRYFVWKTNGWISFLTAVGPPALLIPLLFFHVIPEKWFLPILAATIGAVMAVSLVQPWLRKRVSFWISLVLSCSVQLFAGFWLTTNLVPRSGSNLKEVGLLTIFSGYAVAIPFFLLVQRLTPTEETKSKSV